MPVLSFLTSHTARVRIKTKNHLEKYSKPSSDFFILIALASALASIGIIIDSTPIIIGAMVVAPLITPIFGFSLSIIILRTKTIFLSLLSILLGSSLAILVSIIIGYTVTFIDKKYLPLTSDLANNPIPTLLFFSVALLSGIAGAYAYSKVTVKETITGIAISVTLIPPLALIGLGIASRDWPLVESNLLLYLFNLSGICLGSLIVFLIVGFGNDIEK